MKVVCFDLDDTLYKEIDYLRAAYCMIAQNLWSDDWQKWYHTMMLWYESGDNVFERICAIRSDVEMDGLLNMYRYDVHQLTLSSEVERTLSLLTTAGIELGLISDGRALTQNNKIEALGLFRYFSKDMIVVSEIIGSEKPCERNYRYFMDKYPECSDFTYVGDNPDKDFIAANALGWNTVCLLDDGRNIHKQNFSLSTDFLPKSTIPSLTCLTEIINK